MKLTSILKTAFNAKDSQLTDDSKLMDFEDWDSMQHMLFITKLEEEYAVDLNGDEIANIRTVGDIKKVLTAKGKMD
jgi:acyl carrier protein